MKLSVADTFILLARARTPAERTRILFNASRSPRFNDDQRAELIQLSQERDQASIKSLRPLTNAVEDCKHLDALQETEPPIFPNSVVEVVDEWVNGWRHANELQMGGLNPPGPLLLHGPTGCGKTKLCGTLASRIGRAGVVAECHNFTDRLMGATGERLAQAFRAADKAGSLLVIEELDALSAKRSSSGEEHTSGHENVRITVALMRLIEGAHFPIVATTNRLDALDAALVRRFEFVLEIPPMPDDVRHTIIRGILGEVPAELRELSLNEALPKARRLARKKFLARNPSNQVLTLPKVD